MNKEYKRPDLNAPRFRPKRLSLNNDETFRRFKAENPKCEISASEFKSIVSEFNGMIWKSVIELRDGIELPEQMGHLFIGTCPRKRSNINFGESNKLGIKVQFQNLESDSYLGKIFYTNYESKYKFKFHSLWGFEPVRDFTREAGKSYPTEWKKYVQVDNMIRVSRLFRSLNHKQIKNREEQNNLEDYDEFNFD